MAALGGAALLAMSLFCGLACIVPAAAGLIACGIYRRKKGRKAHIAVRILLWALMVIGAAAAAVPSMYLYLILANWQRT